MESLLRLSFGFFVWFLKKMCIFSVNGKFNVILEIYLQGFQDLQGPSFFVQVQQTFPILGRLSFYKTGF